MQTEKEKTELQVINTGIYESQNDSFSKSNSIISSKYKASLLEQKLLNIVLARLQQRNYVDRGEQEGLVCEIRAKELRDMLGVKGGSFYTQLKPAAAAMTSRTIGFVNDDLERFKYVSLISSAEYDDGLFTVKFNHELKQYLTPKAQFTVLDLPVILHYKSIYSLRLHEILLSKCYKKKKYGASKYTTQDSDGRHFKIELGLSELKLSLGVVNAESYTVQRILNGSSAPDYDKAVEKAQEKSFNNWSDFRKKVIETAVKEINKTENGMTVQYQPLKGGKGAKVYGVLFFVELGSNKKEEKEKSAEKENTINMSEDEQFDVQVQVKSLIQESITLKDIKAICDAANYDIEKIQIAYHIAQSSSSEITNLVGFLVKAIKEEYSKPIKTNKSTKSTNRFNNFEQRQYNFDEYEKRLLNS